ncbi:MAG: YebC/PmpR family DNA-binding transcriptional regulator, partial [Acidobacteriota bacterium]
MSGHSKWNSIRHKKAALDAKRGKLFTRLIKEISVAARIGGGEVDTNPRLRTAVAAAKAGNMPQNNIQRAIMKGTGELPGQSFETVSYEGYGPGGAAVFLEAITDNKNRTVAEIRHIFAKFEGNLAESNAVAWMFERKGYFSIEAAATDEDSLMEVALEAGAEDMETSQDSFEIYCPFEEFETLRTALEQAGIPIQSGELTMIPQNSVKLE